MTQVIHYATRRSLAAAAPLTEAEIKKEQWRKHIAEISKHLDTEPIQSEDLNYEQEEWFRRRMRSPMSKPYKPCTPVEIPYKWQEGTKT
jgi:hypothetical protein